MPRNYMAALVPQQQLVFLLPRGAGGRTPTTTELNGKIAYRRELSPEGVAGGVPRPVQHLQPAGSDPHRRQLHLQHGAPIVNGTPSDLAYAKSFSGAALVKNPNYGHALAYQRPSAAASACV